MKNKIKTIMVIGLMIAIGCCVTGCGTKNNNSTSTKSTKTVNKTTNEQNRAKLEENLKRRIEMLDRRIQQNPNDYRAYTQRAMNKMHQNDYQGASYDINTALQIKPNYSLALSVKKQIEMQSKYEERTSRHPRMRGIHKVRR